jgi:hypothetical protein
MNCAAAERPDQRIRRAYRAFVARLPVLIRDFMNSILKSTSALQTTFSVVLDISYPTNFGYFEENGLLQHPRLVTSTINSHSHGRGLRS